jgi:hypothetical protein
MKTNISLMPKGALPMQRSIPPVGGSAFGFSQMQHKEPVRPLGMCGTDVQEDDNGEPMVLVGKPLSGKTIIGTLNKHGLAELPVAVGTSSLVAHVRAVVDTGAYYTCLSNTVAEALGAKVKGTSRASTPHGDIEMPTYMLSYRLGDLAEACFVSDVRGINFKDVDMLLGTQLLMEFCDFRYFGKEKRFELVFR